MLTRLFILAAFAISLLRADVCESLTAGPSNGLTYWALLGVGNPSPPPLSYRLSVKSDGPAFRLTLTVLKGEPHAGDIEVARCQDGTRIQVLPVIGSRLNFGLSFHADDINFDGYLDFSVLTDIAGTSGRKRLYWVYDPASEKFVQNDLTRELSRDYLGSIDYDASKREISKVFFGAGNSCPGTGESKTERFRVENNRPILVQKHEIEIHQVDLDHQFCTVTVSHLVDGALRFTAVRRFDGRGKPIK
jgi:hypothetical protein